MKNLDPKVMAENERKDALSHRKHLHCECTSVSTMVMCDACAHPLFAFTTV